MKKVLTLENLEQTEWIYERSLVAFLFVINNLIKGYILK